MTALLLALAGVAAAQKLRGNLSILGQQDERTPVVGAPVWIKEIGYGDKDQSVDGGDFRLFLPEIFRAGDEITLQVEKAGYQILNPVGGITRIPAELEKESVRVDLDELGSHRFLSKAAFQLLIENIAEKSKDQVNTDRDNQQPEIDLSRYLKEWATQYGFGIEQVQVELDAWAAEIEQKQEDFYELGLAAFYKKNFGEAAQKFEESAAYHKAELTKAESNARNLKEKVIRDYRMAGDAHYNNYRFQDALSAYQCALAEIDKTADPQRWASVTNGLNKTYWRLGEQVEGQAAQAYLAQAVAGFQTQLEIYTRTTAPQEWATTQNYLGAALETQGKRAGGEEAMRLLDEAVAAYRAALDVRTRAELPLDWAATQNNLGTVLEAQGERTGGADGIYLLAEAVVAYRAALEVRTRADLPQEWAETQTNLGLALTAQGERAGGEVGTRLLAEAVAAYRAALDVYTRADLPQEWARTQNNLGLTLTNQGMRLGGENGMRLLAEAVAAYRAALDVYTRADLPQDWAGTKSNLGFALQAQASLVSGNEKSLLLQEASDILKETLGIYTFEYFASRWANNQFHLAEIYDVLEDSVHAAACYENVLKVYPDQAGFIYHEKLFRFEDAYAFNKRWVQELGHNDIASVSDFIEKHLTTGRFAEAEKLLAEMLPQVENGARLDIPLRAIEIAVLAGQQQTDTIPAKLDTLIALVQQQPEDFKGTWTFNGTKHFLQTADALAPQREWLVTLFAALEGANRDAIARQLEAVRQEMQRD